MKKWLAFLMLVGCGQQEEIKVTRVYVKDAFELRRKCGDDLIIEPLGCARGGNMTIPPSACTIYAMKPMGFDDHRKVETLGHELMHCFDGPIHL